MERDCGWEIQLVHGGRLILGLFTIGKGLLEEVHTDTHMKLLKLINLINCSGIDADQITQQWCVQNPEVCLLSESDGGSTEEDKCDIDATTTTSPTTTDNNGAETIQFCQHIIFVLVLMIFIQLR